VGDLGYSAIDQIAQFGLSSLKVIYYSEQLFSRACENGHPSDGRGRTAARQGHQSLTSTASSIAHNPA
ncbi:hypothetical protein, partial [Klebsiella variicola]|uniref:hypothetical protein n=1 Tax=Klebsiella variicola TaxID=244366 RepID=UPI001C6FCA2D